MPLAPSVLEALNVHYQQLRRWSSTVSLVGPGRAGDVLRRHYGESLAALPLLDTAQTGMRTLLDVGSGAGFPGFVLAAAAPPGWRVVLVEARQRKWAFLESAARRAAVPCLCLNERVELPLPEVLPKRIDLVTSRALRLDIKVWRALLARLTRQGRVVMWLGADPPQVPAELVEMSSLDLPFSKRRRIVVLRREASVGL